MFKKLYERLLQQLSIDYNCHPKELTKGESIIVAPAMNEGRRSYSPGRPFLQMVTTGGSTVIMADECLHEFLFDWKKGEEGYGLFDLGKLSELNEKLKKYGYQMGFTHHMFLPCRKVRPEKRCEVRWLYEEEIRSFYGDKRFPNAISFPIPCPVRPDRMAVIAVEGDTIMGMAGCSEDAPHWQQIGIDVLPEYRFRGIGSYLVTLLKNKIMEQGDIPFYGTAAANIWSQNIAIKSGFKPAWVETEATHQDAGKE